MAGNLQYPLEASNEYRGKIKFTIASSKSTGTEASETRAQNSGASADEASSFSGNTEGKTSTAQPTTSVSDGGVTLYLPPGLQYRDNVAYEGTDLGVVGGFAERGIGLGSAIFDNTQSIVEGLKGDALAGQNEIAKLVGTEIAKLNPKNLLGASAGGVSAAAQVRAGVTLNPNTRVLFKRVNLREFAFSFKLIAKSDKEAQEIEKIVKFFRTQLYPETFSVSGVGVGYKFPELFNIDISYQGSEPDSIWNPPKIKQCYLRDVGTTYNATAMSFHKDGKPMEVDLSLSFMESAALERADVKDGGF
jgi:hypothetical protein